jgi:hypothetical protein
MGTSVQLQRAKHHNARERLIDGLFPSFLLISFRNQRNVGMVSQWLRRTIFSTEEMALGLSYDDVSRGFRG